MLKRRTAKRPAGLRRRATPLLEVLESRQLLTASPLHNYMHAQDVNHDGHVSAIDALLVINDLMRNGSHLVGTADNSSTASPQAATASAASPSASSSYLIDVNGDNRVSVVDALQVINELDATKSMRIASFATDLAGNPISSVQLGETFLIETDVQDIRQPVSPFPGVFSAYADLQYSPDNLISIDPQTPLTGPGFATINTALDLSTAGLVPDVGTFYNSLSSTDTAAHKLWTITVTATAAGTLVLQPSFDFTAGHDDTEFNNDNALQPADVEFDGQQLLIIGPPSISVAAPAAASEGNSGTTPFVFTVSMSNASPDPVMVAFSTVDGSATTADSDYNPTSGTLTFGINETTKLITVLVNGDLKVEGNETFSLLLSNVSANATINANSSVISANDTTTINNDDVLPMFAVSDAQVTSSTTNTTNEVFTVTISGNVLSAATVVYSTANGTAHAGTDYTATSGTLTFNPAGLTTQLVTVTVLANPSPTGDETFQLNLTSPSNATLLDGSGTGTIHPPFVAPTVLLTPANVSQVEGNAGQTAYVFTASLSHSSTQNAVVTFATADGTAMSDLAHNDYVATSGTLTFLPTQTSKLITVLVNGDTVEESNETFTVNLTSGAGASGTASATGTILNDDGVPVATISNATVVAASPGSFSAQFTVSLSVSTTETISIGYQTADFTAHAGIDFTGVGGFLTFGGSQPLSQVITVPILGTSFPTPDVSFFMNISSPTGVAINNSQGVGTIIREGISVLDASVDEGNPGDADVPHYMVFTVSLSLPQDHVVTVAYNTADGTATAANSDYTPTSGTLTFNPGPTQSLSQTVSVAITADTAQEPNETFTLNLSNPVGENLLVDHATGTILNDDGTNVIVTLVLADSNGNPLPPGATLNVDDTFKLEGFVQDARSLDPLDMLRGVSEAYVNVLYDSNLVGLVSGGALTIGPDFPNVHRGDTGTLGQIIGVGGTTALITDPSQIPTDAQNQQLQLLFSIPLMANDNGLATFSVGPTSESGLQIQEFGDETAVPNGAVNFVYTAANPLSINIGHNVFVVDSVSQNEGDSGLTPFVFTVSRLIPDNTVATVQYSTADGNAASGEDYVPTSGTLTFQPGDLTKQVTVMVNGDTKDEFDETFQLKLSNPIGADGVLFAGHRHDRQRRQPADRHDRGPERSHARSRE